MKPKPEIKRRRKWGRWVVGAFGLAIGLTGIKKGFDAHTENQKKRMAELQAFFDRSHLVALSETRRYGTLKKVLGVESDAALKACLEGKGKDCDKLSPWPKSLPAADHSEEKFNILGASCAEAPDKCAIQRSITYRFFCSTAKACEAFETEIVSEYLGSEKGDGFIGTRRSRLKVSGRELLGLPLEPTSRLFGRPRGPQKPSSFKNPPRGFKPTPFKKQKTPAPTKGNRGR